MFFAIGRFIHSVMFIYLAFTFSGCIGPSFGATLTNSTMDVDEPNYADVGSRPTATGTDISVSLDMFHTLLWNVSKQTFPVLWNVSRADIKFV